MHSRPGSRVYPGGITSQPLSPFGLGLYLGLVHKSVPEWLQPKTFNKVPEKDRDPQAAFSREEKRQRWLNVRGCECCKQNFPLADLQGHHKKPYAAGGRTVHSNMALVCEECHSHLSKIRRSVEPKSEGKPTSKGGFRVLMLSKP